ncbi:MAG: hypothetical protein IJQ39_02275 [Thermoguttaceae bacterium]|nr:hypothetical protein [Thermoguttaceae bacterium]
MKNSKKFDSVILLRGIRENCLNNLDVDFPIGGLTVVCGPSGSGKTTLVINTLFAESQRRFIETVGTRRRGKFSLWKRPDLDSIENLPPAATASEKVDLNQTLAQLCGMDDALALAFSRHSVPICPHCGIKVPPGGAASAAEYFESHYSGCRAQIAFVPSAAISEYAQRGFSRWLIERDAKVELVDRNELLQLNARNLQHATIHVLADRLTFRPRDSRTKESFELAFVESGGKAVVFIETPEGTVKRYAGQGRTCPQCGQEFSDNAVERFYLSELPEEPSERDKILAYQLDGKNLLEWYELSADQIAARSEGLKGGNEVSEAVRSRTGNRTRFCLRKADFGVTHFQAGTDLVGGITHSPSGELVHGCAFGGSPSANCVTSLPLVVSLPPFISCLLPIVSCLQDAALGYMPLSRKAETMSGGQIRRAAMASMFAGDLVNMLYVFDEPMDGVPPENRPALLSALLRLRDRGNTVVVADNDASLIQAADCVVELGDKRQEITGKRQELTTAYCLLPTASITISPGKITAIAGPAGSGKTTLLSQLAGKPVPPDRKRPVTGLDAFEDVILVERKLERKPPRGCVATYLGIWDSVRAELAATPESQARGFTPGDFSLMSGNGRCPQCKGEGVLTIDLEYLPEIEMVCSECMGERFQKEYLQPRFRGLNAAEILRLTVQDAFSFFRNIRSVQLPLTSLIDIGLERLELGQPIKTLSAGERSRLDLAKALQKIYKQKTLFLLDEPSAGLHDSELDKLIESFRRLTAYGHTVVMIENNPWMVQQSDVELRLG